MSKPRQKGASPNPFGMGKLSDTFLFQFNY